MDGILVSCGILSQTGYLAEYVLRRGAPSNGKICLLVAAFDFFFLLRGFMLSMLVSAGIGVQHTLLSSQPPVLHWLNIEVALRRVTVCPLVSLGQIGQHTEHTLRRGAPSSSEMRLLVTEFSALQTVCFFQP